MRRRDKLVLLVALGLFVAGCAGREPVRTGDGPGRALDPRSIEVPQPRPEPLARYGNHTPYTVLGRTYHVLPTAVGYVERGHASWYGSKFHGRPTSSGEPFDMYRVSAAHKSLPLPSWVEVTNLDNGRSLVVRVNDRGPFVEGRIIDLSYAAAVKLDVVRTGTAPVEVRAITFAESPRRAQAMPERVPVLVQVGAFSDRVRADALAQALRDAGISDVGVAQARTSSGRVWRVRVGPVRDRSRAGELHARILALGLGPPLFVYP